MNLQNITLLAALLGTLSLSACGSSAEAVKFEAYSDVAARDALGPVVIKVTAKW